MSAENYGTVVADAYIGSKTSKGTSYAYKVFTPNGHDASKPCAMIFSFDHQYETFGIVMSKLMAENKAPDFVVIAMAPGDSTPKLEGSQMRGRRIEYDTYGRDFPNFIVDEFLPYVIEKHDLNIDPNPDMHLITGGSSGGCIAWNAAWFRNDCFRRVYMSSPSFLAMCDMDRHATIVRKTEGMPIKSFMTCATNEPDEYFGSTISEDERMARSLKFAGYEHQYEVLEGNHCEGYFSEEYVTKIMTYLWENYEEPLTVKKNPPKFDRYLAPGSKWEKVDAMPEKIKAVTPDGEYTTDGGKIYFTDKNGNKKLAAEDLTDISGLAISSDYGRLYAVDNTRSCIFVYSIYPDGKIDDLYKIAPIHIDDRCGINGIYGICVDVNDKIYLATNMGVQSSISFGIIDMIMPINNHETVYDVAFGGEDNKYLYVKAESGIYRREMNDAGRKEDSPSNAPVTTHYYA